MLVIKFSGMANGSPSPFDGLYLKEYDPGKQGWTPTGKPMAAHIVVVGDPAQAMQFKDLVALMEVRNAIDPEFPERPDGKPNRPLTAFTIEITDLSNAAVNDDPRWG